MELFGMQRGITTQNTWTVHDWCVNQFSLTYPVSPGPNLAADFHQYGLLWVNDGSAHGTMSLWFDGVQQGSYTLDSRSMLWDDGIYLINQMVPCTTYKTPPCASSGNDPMQIDYVRAYQAQ